LPSEKQLFACQELKHLLLVSAAVGLLPVLSAAVQVHSSSFRCCWEPEWLPQYVMAMQLCCSAVAAAAVTAALLCGVVPYHH
jgi:hypothetical protein